MNAFDELKRQYLINRLLGHSQDFAPEWAQIYLHENRDESDSTICALASIASPDEPGQVNDAILAVLDRRCPILEGDQEVVVGKYLIQLSERYRSQSVSIDAFLESLNKIFEKLNQPAWLQTLVGACDLASEKGSAVEIFERELEYISSLWASARSLNEFLAVYDPQVSASRLPPSVILL